MSKSVRVVTWRQFVYFAFLFGSVALFARLVVPATQSPETLAVTTAACPTTYALSISGSPTSGVITGLVNVSLSASPTTTGTTNALVNRVMFKIDSNKILGRGVMSTTSQYFWSMQWQSSVTANGQHTIGAEVFHDNGFACTIATGPVVFVNNATRTTIPIQYIVPATWSGPTNYPIDFELLPATTTTTADLRRFMQIEWSTTIGSITATSPLHLGRFFSGTSGGTGSVRGRVLYGGEIKDLNAPVSVTAFVNQTTTTTTTTNTTTTDQTAPSSGSTTDSTSDDTTTTTDDSNQTTATDSTGGSTQTIPTGTSPTLTQQLLSTDSSVRDCLLSSIGAVRLQAIEQEKSRPTSIEFDKYRKCFARQSFVVAQPLAPVAPDKVRDLTESKNVVIKKAENFSTEVEGTQVDQIILRGTAKPNSTVLIYIFSEPLVLTTVANEDGEWTYTLEDPLEPGEHEAYSLVDTGDGDYERSSVFNFVIKPAAASEANPNGYSLQLATTATATADVRSRNFFITVAVTLVLFTIGTMLLVLKLQHKRTTVIEGPMIMGAPNEVQPDNNQKPYIDA